MILSPSLYRRGFLGAAGVLAAGSALAQLPPPAPMAGPASGPAPAPGGSQPVIDVDHAQTDPIRIALPVLGNSAAATEINSVITADLLNCGLFKPIDQAAFISAADANPTAPNFQNWKAIGAQALVTGNVTEIGGGQVRVEFRLWDVLTGQQLQGTAYTSPNVRRIGHIIADVIYERMLGEKGYFDTRIVYVAATGPRGRQTKRLAIMDQDAANNRVLTDGSWLVLTPRFNPVRDEIAFMSYASERPAILAGRIRGHELRAPLQPRWRQLHHVGHARGWFGHLRGGRGIPHDAAIDPLRQHRHQPVLQPRWQPDRVQFGP